MAKTLRIRPNPSGGDWVVKPAADLPENRLTAEEVDDNFLALEADLNTHEATHPAPTTRDARNEAADATILKEAHIVNNLTTNDATAPLSAAQGKVLGDGKEPTITPKNTAFNKDFASTLQATTGTADDVVMSPATNKAVLESPPPIGATAENTVKATTINATSTTDATSTTAGGAMTVAGGLAVAKKAYFGGSVFTNSHLVIGKNFNDSSTQGCLYSFRWPLRTNEAISINIEVALTRFLDIKVVYVAFSTAAVSNFLIEGFVGNAGSLEWFERFYTRKTDASSGTLSVATSGSDLVISKSAGNQDRSGAIYIYCINSISAPNSITATVT